MLTTKEKLDFIEVGIRNLIYFSRYIGFPQFFFIITSIIIIVCFTYIYHKYSPNFFISSLAFIAIPVFWISSFSIIRQFTAMSIILLSTKFIFNRQIIYYTIFVFIATLFHTTAIIALFLYPLFFIKLNTKWTVMFLITFSFLGDFLIDFLIQHLLPAYYVYIEYSVGDGAGGQTNLLLFIIIGIILIIFKNKMTMVTYDKEFNFFFNSYFFGLSMYIMLNKYGHAGMRGSLYFTMYLPILIAYYSEIKIKKLKKEIQYISFCAIFFLLYIATIYIAVWKGVESSIIPYRTFLFN
jgi:hypothetical protein